jgi:hypothetical protein
MPRMPFVLSVAIAFVFSGTGRADTLPLFNNVPAQYTPGTPFTFQITLPTMLSDGSAFNGLSNYQVGLVFDAAVNSPALSVSAAPPASGYVFSSTSGFTQGSFAGPGQNEVSLQFSDSIAPNIVTVGPGNDILADITVSTGSTLTGPITVSFTSNTSVTYFNEGIDVTPPAVTIDQGSAPPPSVPTPAGWVTLAIGTCILAIRKRIWG